MFHYRVFLLNVASEIEFPGWPPIAADAPSDVTIERGEVSPSGLSAPETRGFAYQGTPTEWWIQIPGLARFLISGGRTITMDSPTSVDTDTLRLFGLNACLGPLLWQRGRFLLHGTAVQWQDRALAFLGTSGAGKSTLAASFAERGLAVLSDGFLVLDEQARILPAFPGLSLWRDVIRKLDIAESRLRRVRPELEKYTVEFAPPCPAEAVPIGTALVLTPGNHQGPALEPIRGMKKITPLLNHLFRHSPWMGTQSPLPRCARLAQQIDLARFNRPLDGFYFEKSRALIEDHWRQSEASRGA